MIKRLIQKRERYLAMLNDNRVVRPFEWGAEFVEGSMNGSDPLEFFKKHSRAFLDSSDDRFALAADPVFDESEPDPQQIDGTSYVSWASALTTSSEVNNIAHARLFHIDDDKRAAAVVLPHWNAREGSYINLCSNLKRFGVSALRLTLPYHEERMPEELDRADHLVSPNVGRTLQSVRQSVLDTKAAVKWLYSKGYENVGVVGTSIGSCVAFLAFVHDETIKSAVFNHVSGTFADVVWRGLSTYHVREGLEQDISIEDLREVWMPISPLAYIDKLASLEPRPQRYIYTLYDLSFPIDLSRNTMKALNKAGIEHDETVIPCGHYTLGEKPWIYLDGYKIISFLRRTLRSATIDP
ncbi:MAG: hypothetical protein DWQ47_13975 [Acidobacteria bacterium]|nr:MAG: hypothetical protein DWQ32_01375 [Acidobacteriota bacterium]REK02822.1 MAG: hypothetical protein DWQ38_10760 [Acidobacteriota bacterium]REK13374.1 MAG: hypothetical protein DWQ43_07065 [Acidobacteriota bacterium]REK41368.1 MAG: hypothetical protein DWQ47_13975 [Acidobacteriota bacterium]